MYYAVYIYQLISLIMNEEVHYIINYTSGKIFRKFKATMMDVPLKILWDRWVIFDEYAATLKTFGECQCLNGRVLNKWEKRK